MQVTFSKIVFSDLLENYTISQGIIYIFRIFVSRRYHSRTKFDPRITVEFCQIQNYRNWKSQDPQEKGKNFDSNL